MAEKTSSQDFSNDPPSLDDPATPDDPQDSDHDTDEGDDLPDVSYDPPDGGYGWLVVLCGWFNLLVMSGTYSVFGMMYPYLLHTFGAGDVYTVAIITSTFFSMFAICEYMFCCKHFVVYIVHSAMS